MDTLEVRISENFTVAGSKQANGGVASFSNPITKSHLFTIDRTDIGNANLVYSGSRTLAASATENLDLAGVLTDPFGDVITPAEIVAIHISASGDNTNNVVIGNAATNGFVGPLGATGTYTVAPGEYVTFVSEKGWGVTAGTADLLKVANSAGGSSVKYTIVIVGRTVAK